ncbi:MAG: tripartite tricarboxylate transporter permease [Candidatus Euphemobacter frigidus]|nr:tripartite tricarboxylate transporter permease [Candidatus Euphemobacter frigidus]MDP8276326.1 tripartite tricarboxylate transporter permease [Candidatus Euphemobacter frigidus]
MEISSIVIATLLGTVLGGFLFWIPGIRFLSIFGILLSQISIPPLTWTNPEVVFVFFMALTVSASFAEIIPAFFFGAPSASTIFLVVPGRRYLKQGCSYQGSMTVGLGSLIGVFLLVAATPFFIYLYTPLFKLIRMYYRWVPGILVLYMVGGEFIFHLRQVLRFHRKDEYRALFIAPVIFLLIGLFGVISLQYRQFAIVDHQGTFSSAFAGLFLLPPLIRRLIRPVGGKLEEDNIPVFGGRRAGILGGIAGGIGGFLTLLLPAVSSGLGALIAGHFIPRRKEKAFLISQGMVKTIYSAGAFLLFFIPTIAFKRGSTASILKSRYHADRNLQSFLLIVAVVLISGCLSYYILGLTSRLARRIVRKVTSKILSSVIIGLVTAIIFFRYGPEYMLILFTAACLGSLPLVFGCRRSNTFSVILVPILLFMMGWYQTVINFLGFF